MAFSRLNTSKIFNFSIILLFLAGLFVLFPIKETYASSVQCADVKVDISNNGSDLSCDVTVQEATNYGVFLEHFYPKQDKESRQAFRKTLGIPVFEGDKGSKSMSAQTYPYSLRVQIISTSPDVTFFMHAKIAPEADISGKYSVMAELLRVYLIPGTYRVKITVTRTSPELKNIETKLKFLNSRL